MNINQIIEAFKSDTAFAAKYSALTSVEAVLEQAKADGFDITAEDVQAAISQLGKQSGELSEDDLAAVAGGSKDRSGMLCNFTPKDKNKFQYERGTTRIQCGTFCAGGNLTTSCACYKTNNCVSGWHLLDNSDKELIERTYSNHSAKKRANDYNT